MTREELFRALGEVREDQIEGAETVKKQSRPWRRYGALAACLAVVLAAGAGIWFRDQARWRALLDSSGPLNQPETALSGGTDAGGGLDGSDYQAPAGARPASSYSVNAEIGQLSGPGDGGVMQGSASCMAWLSPEEILAQDTVIFRGTVRELQYFHVTAGGWDSYYTRALVEVTDPIRGKLAAGETCSVLWLGAKGYLSTSLSGPLDEVDAGSEAIFMPVAATSDTGWKEGGSYFCYADLADYYLSEGSRYVFLDNGEGLNFNRGLYTDLAESETLEDAAAYLRARLNAAEPPQTVVVPAVPETPPADPEVVWLEEEAAPSETAQAGEVSGAAGARELPGGALAETED